MADLRSPEKRYRPEIEGIRTVATLLVVMYHMWFGKVSGGIDVFFVLSGYLITLSLLSRIERSGKVEFGNFWFGLATRLFPQALFVIIVIGSLSLILLPKFEWNEIIAHMTASTFAFENWRLAFDAVDYLASDEFASPFQHYWSLGVQGQFYLLWPCVILLSYWLARDVLHKPVRKTLAAVLAVIFTVSLGYSIYITSVNQPWAYFDTFARMWEFAAGGLFALFSPYLVFNKKIHTLLGWSGLAVICLTGVLVPVSDVFPGVMAMIPILGTVFVLTAAENSSKIGVDRLLGMRPFIYLGGLSYGIYLWHWPLLIFYQTATNQLTVPFSAGLEILFVTAVLAFITTNMLERPVLKLKKYKREGKLTSVLVVLLLTAEFTAISIAVYIDNAKAVFVPESAEQAVYPGAQSIFYDIEPAKFVDFIPSSLEVRGDLPAFYDDAACVGKDEIEVKKCSFGKTDNPAYTVALVGGSHSGHWFPALDELAEELDFQIDVYNSDGCRFTNEDPDNHLTKNCLKWNENLIEQLKESPPDLVFTTATLNKHRTVPAGYIGQWKELEDISTVFAVRDNPRMKENIPLCLEYVDDPMKCAIDREQGISDEVPWENTAGIPDNVIFADLSDYFCDEQTCYPVIGNIIVYRDNNHLTAAYSKTMAPALKAPLEKALAGTDSRKASADRE